MKFSFSILGVALMLSTNAIAQNFSKKIDKLASNLEPKVIEWRHHFHQFPELSNREFKTAEKIAKHLQNLGMEVQTGVAHTGVVGILKGGKPGPVVGLRADIDGLPVTERVNLTWASKEKTTFNQQNVGTMHACGHDTHIAILMGVAELLSQLKAEIPGTIKFIFQPAEEGAPVGEEGGASMMVKEGVLKNPDVDVIFGLHIWSSLETGKIWYKSGGIMASSNSFTIEVKGQQAHGAYPWLSTDPIVTASQIVNNLQTVVSRNLNLTKEGAVVTVGSIHGGVRNNIIPETVKMEGTIRSLDAKMQQRIYDRMNTIVTNTAESNGAQATLTIHKGNPITYNDPELFDQMISTIHRTAGEGNASECLAFTGAEDFSWYQKEIPGFFFFLGGMPKGQDPSTAPAHHTPDFYVVDDGLVLGIRTLSNLALDYMTRVK